VDAVSPALRSVIRYLRKSLRSPAKQSGHARHFRDGFATDPNAATGPISDSYAEFMWGWHWLFTFGRAYYRPIGEPPKDEGEGVTTINETIDVSVFDRWRADRTYRPPKLQAWATSKGIDLAKITSSVRVDDPKAPVVD
jgi:hypothetical protein